MNLGAVILAGGRSRRMGRDKAWLLLDGRPLIGHSLGIVRSAGIRELMISGRADQDFSALQCPVVLDALPSRGPLGGIERGLDATSSCLLFVLAVDLARMSPDCLRWLASHCEGSTGAIPILRGRSEPLAAVYPKASHALANRRLSRDLLSARAFADACIAEGLACAAEVPDALEPCFANWNTPEDARHP